MPGADLAVVPVVKESARGLARDLQSGRGVSIVLIGEIVGQEHWKLNHIYKRVLYVKVRKMDVALRSGKEVGSLELNWAVGGEIGDGGVRTCEQIKVECQSAHAVCKEQCGGIEDVVEKVFCHGRCRETWRDCEDQC